MAIYKSWESGYDVCRLSHMFRLFYDNVKVGVKNGELLLDLGQSAIMILNA